MRQILALLLLCIALNPAHAGKAAQTAPPPVYEGDISRPYEVVGKIKASLRKHFAMSPDPSKEKIYAELWERARKMDADAVIYAWYGPTEKTLSNFGKTPISGTAIKYTDSAEPTPAAQ